MLPVSVVLFYVANTVKQSDSHHLTGRDSVGTDACTKWCFDGRVEHRRWKKNVQVILFFDLTVQLGKHGHNFSLKHSNERTLSTECEEETTVLTCHRLMCIVLQGCRKRYILTAAFLEALVRKENKKCYALVLLISWVDNSEKTTNLQHVER